MRPFGVLVLSLALGGCLDFSPGTPSSGQDGGSKKSTPGVVDMATAPTSKSKPDMATGKPTSTGPADMAVLPLGMQLCDATLAITGSYTQGSAPPSGFPGGCWPDGTWSFTATVTQNPCATAPVLAPQYQFKVVEDDDFNDTITYLTDPSNMYVVMRISGGDGGVCVGGFQVYSADGKTITNLRPALQANGTLDGQGDYAVYDTDQRN